MQLQEPYPALMVDRGWKMTFGTPQDITPQELRIKRFFRADAESATNFHRWAADGRKRAAVASPVA